MNLFNVVIQDDEEDILAHALVRTLSTDEQEIAEMVACDGDFDREDIVGWSWTVTRVNNPDAEGVLSFNVPQRGDFSDILDRL